MGYYKIKHRKWQLWNKWKHESKYTRGGNWIIIGFAKEWFGIAQYCYKLCFFGFELKLWITREWIENNRDKRKVNNEKK